MKIAYIGNQGGRDVLAIYAGMARTLADSVGAEAVFTVWLDSEIGMSAELGAPGDACLSFETFVRSTPPADDAAVDRLVREYREVNWSEVVAAERAFTDYSMLLGSAGDRRETPEYVQRLVVAIVHFLETGIAGSDAIVCQTADTLFSLIAFKVAHHLGIPAYAISPAWLLEPGTGGGFFANSEYLECRRMTEAFAARAARPLTSEEWTRTTTLIESIRGFSGKTAFHEKTSKSATSGRRALSPNVWRIASYLIENARRDKDVIYAKIDPARKVRANLLRLFRKRTTKDVFGPADTASLPPRSVFYAIHYQPEQSTLAQGIWHVNQVALIENISKSLPLGYTLIVKEHPWGRGNRPRWQYEHLAGLYNVTFCDAPAKEIIQKSDAVVAVSGTVAMEALAFDKPTILLGRNFFEFSDLIYRSPDIRDLPELLAKILIDGDHRNQPNRDDRLRRFLMAYLDGLVPAFPLAESAAIWAEALKRELGLVPNSISTHTEGDA